MNFNSIEDVNTFLHSIPVFSAEGSTASDFSLDRFKRFCASTGNRQQEFASVHVAGSNGKGSTCNIIAAIYRQAGYRVGAYTSPHLIDMRERFTINGVQISPEALCHFFQDYYSQVKSLRLTYFEIMTAIAFWWFAEEDIDIGVIEVGLGGRLDATNVITPEVSVITSITLDHTDILGDTIQEITREKAGIIKQNVPTVVGHLPPDAMNEIKQVAAEKDSDLYTIDELKPRLQTDSFQLQTSAEQLTFDISFYNPVQAYNLAMGWQVRELLNKKWKVSNSQLKQAFWEAGRSTNHPGRFEKVHPRNRWYFDGAHNVEALRAMKEAVNTVGMVEEAVLILSLMSDKLNDRLKKELLEFKKIVYYTPTTKRGATLHEVSKRLPGVIPFPADKQSRYYLLDELKSELVIFGGSLYFYSTVKNWLATYT